MGVEEFKAALAEGAAVVIPITGPDENDIFEWQCPCGESDAASGLAGRDMIMWTLHHHRRNCSSR